MPYFKKSSYDLFQIIQITLAQLHLFVCNNFETIYNSIATANKRSNLT